MLNSSHWRDRLRLLLQLTRRDFKAKYQGSAFGLLWAFIQPLALMLTLLFVFNYGLRAQVAEPGIPYAPWFFAAMIAWNFFQDSTLSAQNSVQEYSFLVKKVSFPTDVLPVVKILSAAMIHLIFVGILIVVILASGLPFSWTWLQFPYFALSLMCLTLGLSWALASMNLFVRDVSQFVSILLQLGFWATPVVWNTSMLPPSLQVWFKLNPLLYIVEGYRATFLHGQPFWEVNPLQAIYFWSVVLLLCVAGRFTFKRLQPHFADVL
jgi:ABC-type polysaccharide/polyol phosphate export permease